MRILFFIGVVVFLTGCGSSNPADESGSVTVQSSAVVQSIDLAGASVLALREKETAVGASYSPGLSKASQSVVERCDELGRLDGVAYKGLDIKDKQGGSLTPCFREVHFIQDNMIYGQYKQDGDINYISFITSSDGKVHHLPKGVNAPVNHPKKPAGFKSDKLIRMYKGKPLYLNYSGFLVTLNPDTDEETEVHNVPVGNFVIIPKNTGDHIVYHDLGGGHIMRPNGGIEDLPELNTYRFYYRNASNDLTYVSTGIFKNMLLDPDGFILDRAASAIPVAYEKFITDPSGSTPNPSTPRVSTSMSSCEVSDNLMICEGNYVKGYILSRSDEDLKVITWLDYDVLHIQQACLTDNFIYAYSEADGQQIADGQLINIYVRRLTQIKRDLSASENIITNIDVDSLTCLKDGRLLISGRNTDTSVNEKFHFDPALRIKTMITENITEFIN